MEKESETVQHTEKGEDKMADKEIQIGRESVTYRQRQG